MLMPTLISIRSKPKAILPSRGATSSLSIGRTLRNVSEVFFLVGAGPIP